MLHPAKVASSSQKERTDSLFAVAPSNQFKEKVQQFVRWEKPKDEAWSQGYRLFIHFSVLLALSHRLRILIRFRTGRLS